MVAGANKGCVVYTKDGVKLGLVGGDQVLLEKTVFSEQPKLCVVSKAAIK